MNNSCETGFMEEAPVDVASEKSDFRKTIYKLAVFGAVCVFNKLFLIYIFIYPYGLIAKGLDKSAGFEAAYLLSWIVNELCVYFFPILAAYFLFKTDFKKRGGYKSRYEFHPVFTMPVIFLSSIFAGSLATIITNAVADVFDSWFGTGEIPDAMEGTMPPEGEAGGLAIAMIFLVITAPVCEELLVRGILLTALRKHGEWFGIIVSALVFGFIHGNLDQLPYAFVVGILYGLLAVRSGSVIPSMILHSVNNLLVVLGSYLTQITGEIEPAVSLQRWVGICLNLFFWIGILATVTLFAAKLHKLPGGILSSKDKARELIRNTGIYFFGLSLAALMVT